MPNRTLPLTPWGKAVKIKLLSEDMAPRELVAAIRARGILITETTLSKLLSGTAGQRSPAMVAAIDEILGISPEVEGRPA